MCFIVLLGYSVLHPVRLPLWKERTPVRVLQVGRYRPRRLYLPPYRCFRWFPWFLRLFRQRPCRVPDRRGPVAFLAGAVLAPLTT